MLPRLHVYTSTARLQHFIPPRLHAPQGPCNHTSVSPHLHRASRPPDLQPSIPPRRYTYRAPPDLRTSMIPCLHAYRASPALHTFIPPRPLRLQRASSASEVHTLFFYACTPEAHRQCSIRPYFPVAVPIARLQSSRARCFHVYTRAESDNAGAIGASHR